MLRIFIKNKGKTYEPLVEDEVTFSTERKGAPGQLNFKVVKDDYIDFQEGNEVRCVKDDKEVFFGFVFTKKRNKEHRIDVTCYDQLRYLKNKDTIVYENKTASEFLKMIANDFNLKVGAVEDTKFKIKSRVEENTTLFDMVQNALDETLQNTKQMYVLYDNFGKLTLKNISNMKTDLLIDEDCLQDFDYTSSIDVNTYNTIKLSYKNKKTGKRDIYITKDGNNINKWGILQYFEDIKSDKNAKAKADALLELYNHKTRNLTLKGVFGNLKVRAGSMVIVNLNIGDIITKNYFIVEKCKHIFKSDEHFMDLLLIGGDFSA